MCFDLGHFLQPNMVPLQSRCAGQNVCLLHWTEAWILLENNSKLVCGTIKTTGPETTRTVFKSDQGPEGAWNNLSFGIFNQSMKGDLRKCASLLTICNLPAMVYPQCHGVSSNSELDCDCLPSGYGDTVKPHQLTFRGRKWATQPGDVHLDYLQCQEIHSATSCRPQPSEKHAAIPPDDVKFNQRQLFSQLSVMFLAENWAESLCLLNPTMVSALH